MLLAITGIFYQNKKKRTKLEEKNLLELLDLQNKLRKNNIFMGIINYKYLYIYFNSILSN